jgi:hypothetical protein
MFVTLNAVDVPTAPVPLPAPELVKYAHAAMPPPAMTAATVAAATRFLVMIRIGSDSLRFARTPDRTRPASVSLSALRFAT